VTALPNVGLLTAADLSYEPDDGLRRELYDGVLPGSDACSCPTSPSSSI
jgi:hypothetical protein